VGEQAYILRDENKPTGIFSMRVGGGEGWHTICQFMKPEERGRIRWQEQDGIPKKIA
jgi:hypothetical protein